MAAQALPVNVLITKSFPATKARKGFSKGSGITIVPPVPATSPKGFVTVTGVPSCVSDNEPIVIPELYLKSSKPGKVCKNELIPKRSADA